MSELNKYMEFLEKKKQTRVESGFNVEEKDLNPALFPLLLLQMLIHYFTNEGDIIADPFMGSGTTAVACINEKRHFIGFELNEEYYKKACERIWNKQRQLTLF